MPTAPNPRVLVSGQPTVLLSAPWTVAGCALASVPSPPCVTGQWVMGTVRVTSNGQPLVIQSGQAVCIPTGTPLLPVTVQLRASAT
jgi:hypothetical protein